MSPFDCPPKTTGTVLSTWAAKRGVVSLLRAPADGGNCSSPRPVSRGTWASLSSVPGSSAGRCPTETQGLCSLCSHPASTSTCSVTLGKSLDFPGLSFFICKAGMTSMFAPSTCRRLSVDTKELYAEMLTRSCCSPVSTCAPRNVLWGVDVTEEPGPVTLQNTIGEKVSGPLPPRSPFLPLAPASQPSWCPLLPTLLLGSVTAPLS